VIERTTRSRPQNLPLSLITGDLGSGKTTLLSRIVQLIGPDIKLGLIVNDYSSLNIDSEDLSEISPEGNKVIELSSGCVCCSLKDGLQDAVANLSRSSKLEYLIVETSGVADPSTTMAILENELSSDISLESVIHVVDVDRFEATGFGFADIVLLNKSDLVDTCQLDSIIDDARKVCTACIIPCSYGAVDIERILRVTRIEQEREGFGRIVRKKDRNVSTCNEALRYMVANESSLDLRRTAQDSSTQVSHLDRWKTISFESVTPLSFVLLQQLLFLAPQLHDCITRLKGTLHLYEFPDTYFKIQQSGNQRVSISNLGNWPIQPCSKIAVVTFEDVATATIDVLNACTVIDEFIEEECSLANLISNDKNFELLKTENGVIIFQFTARKSFNFSAGELMDKFNICMLEANSNFSKHFNMRSSPYLLLPLSDGHLAMNSNLPAIPVWEILCQSAQTTITADFLGRIRMCKCD